MPFLTSTNPTDWHEDPIESSRRANLTASDPADLKRTLFPLRARLVKDCRMVRLPAGHIFPYARVMKEPAIFPVQVLIEDTPGRVRVTRYSSDEVDILTAEA